MTINKFGAGGVVVKRVDGGFKVLLIKDGYGHWTWPKGHIEKGETPAGTAAREISEETGLSSLEVMDEIGRQEYYFTLKGEKVFKRVHIFLVEAKGEDVLKPQVEEIMDAVWMDPDKALSTIEYEGSREMLRKGIELFKRRPRS